MRGAGRPLAALAVLLLTATPAPAGAASLPPSLALRPNCGPAGGGPPPSPQPSGSGGPTYTIEVIGRGLPPGQGDVVFNPGETQESFAATTDANGALDVVIHPFAVPKGAYVVDVESFHLEAVVARALFTVPCPPTPPPATPTPSAGVSPSPRITPTPQVLNPTLTLTPAVGPPGTVTVAHGAGFPPNVSVQLAWSQGIAGTTSAGLVSDAAGAFTATVLVLPHDALGTRVLTALSAPPPGSTQIGFASAFFLVTPGAVQPSDFSWRR
ncbi:MAG TPA: hypothetical protein VOB72_18000 [Candidatus Dormibacteraeota bacterium]|nr:hypothetical protein [Candidatus Dormibacteraeota bacterium]